jgi:transposase
MNRADYYRWLARDMAEAERRADVNALDNKGCWEELKGILAEHGAELDSPTPTRPYRPRVPTASLHDIEIGRAIKEAISLRRGLSS